MGAENPFNSSIDGPSGEAWKILSNAGRMVGNAVLAAKHIAIETVHDYNDPSKPFILRKTI